jgi:hypothetical protein
VHSWLILLNFESFQNPVHAKFSAEPASIAPIGKTDVGTIILSVDDDSGFGWVKGFVISKRAYELTDSTAYTPRGIDPHLIIIQRRTSIRSRKDLFSGFTLISCDECELAYQISSLSFFYTMPLYGIYGSYVKHNRENNDYWW